MKYARLACLLVVFATSASTARATTIVPMSDEDLAVSVRAIVEGRVVSREAAWDRLLQLHHAIRPKPKGKPTFRLVVQMHGEHGYRRVDAHKALARGLAGKLPAAWRHVDEDAAVEIWLTIQGTWLGRHFSAK